MAYRKLNLDWDKVNQCRDLAARVVKPIQRYIDRHSTLSIESATLCLLGAQGPNERKPFADIVITKLDLDRMRRGISYWFGRALVHTKLPASALAAKIADGHISFQNIPDIPVEKIKSATLKLAADGLAKIDEAAASRKQHASRFESIRQPVPLLLISPDNNYELKTFASDEATNIILFKDLKHFELNFDELRKKGQKLKKFAVAVSGLGCPRQAIHALNVGADFIARDTLKDVILDKINPKRAFVDSHWMRRLCARSQSIIISECAHLQNVDAYREAHQILVSQFIEERFGSNADITPELFAVGHTFNPDPSMEDGYLHELARAALIREIYPRSPVVFLPPSNPSALFCIAGMITEQSIIVVPTAKNKFDELKNMVSVINNCRTLGDEVQFNQNGKIARRANTVLENASRVLKKMEQAGFLETLGIDDKSGSGLEGVFQKERDYFDPIDLLLQKKPEETYCLATPEPIIRPEQERQPYKGRRHGRYRHHRKSAFKKPPQGSDQGG